MLHYRHTRRTFILTFATAFESIVAAFKPKNLEALVESEEDELHRFFARRDMFLDEYFRALEFAEETGAFLGTQSSSISLLTNSAAQNMPFPVVDSLEKLMKTVPLWKSRLDGDGDNVVHFPQQRIQDIMSSPTREVYNFNSDGRIDYRILSEAMNKFKEPVNLNGTEQRPIVIAPFYVWYKKGLNTSWRTAQSIPTRGRYDSKDPKIYLSQRDEAHRHGIDVFAVSTFQHKEFIDLLNKPEVRKKGPEFNKFLWLYEIADSLRIGHEDLDDTIIPIIDFDEGHNRNKFIKDMLELAEHFDENYMLLDGKYFPVWFWVTDIFRGDFLSVAQEARAIVKEKLAKKNPGKNYEIALIAGENPLFPQNDANAQNRLRAFYGTAGYGIYTALFTRFFGGRLSKEHTDLIMEKMKQGINIIENTDTIYGTKGQFFGVSQFGYKDDRDNPTLTANTSEIVYYLQQLQKIILMRPNRSNYVIHTSYNEHREGHALEPTDGYNFGKLWLGLMNLFFGPSYYHRRMLANRKKE